MTRDEFLIALAPLGSLRQPPADPESHWIVCQRFSLAAVDAGAMEAVTNRVWFPTPAELRMDIEAAMRRQPLFTQDEDRAVDLEAPVVVGTVPQTLVPIVATKIWKYYCDVCSDQGMRTWHCGPASTAKGWLETRACGRRDCGDGAYARGHEWAERCPCAATNPEVRRREEMRQRTMAVREAKGHARA